MAVLVKDVMIKDVVTISDKATIGEAVEIFATKEIGCLPMVDENGALTAFLSDGDIVYYVVSNVRLAETESKNYRYRYPKEICTNYFTMLLQKCVGKPAYNAATHRVVTVAETDTVRRTAEIMQKKHLKHLPVLDENGKLIGLITRNDIINGLFRDYLEDPDAPCIEGYDY
ncbi:MAG: CBS domain-containing protein [Peptococcaceae bacterium]|nr:CBS domain-containing protein [Peptococcaceae bacterium]